MNTSVAARFSLCVPDFAGENFIQMKQFVAGCALALLTASSALAQGLPVERNPATTGAIITRDSNITGNETSVMISAGATGAETINTNSAAGGNAGDARPSQFPYDMTKIHSRAPNSVITGNNSSIGAMQILE